MLMKNGYSRFSAALFSLLFFANNCVLAHVPEANFWAERRSRLPKGGTLQTAGLPMSSAPAYAPRVLENLPAADNHALSLLNASGLAAGLESRIPREARQRLVSLLGSLSPAYGTVRGIAYPASASSESPVVLHVQDVHMNLEAQKNIGKAVESAAKTGEAGLIGLEGTSGPIRLAGYQAFPEQAAIRKTADYLLRENRISGPVHAAMTSGRAFAPLVGVDDKARHEANVSAYKRAAPLADGYRRRLAGLEQSLANEKALLFNPALKEFDDHVARYHAGQESLGEYARFLRRDHLPSAGRELRPADEFLKALDMELSLDFKQVERERARLVEELVRRLEEGEISRLVDLSAAYRLGRVRHGGFYAALKDFCTRNGVSLGRYPAMESYIRYTLLSDRIDAGQLFDALKRLEKAGYDRLARSPAERDLAARSKRLYLTRKLLDFSLTRDEWEEYKALAERRESGTGGGGRSVRALGLSLEPFETFYDEARARDRSMADNLLKAAAARRARAAVLVTGGFHGDGVEEHLKKAGAVVISFVPRLTHVDTAKGSGYLSVFSQEKTPLEEIFEGQKLFLAADPKRGMAEAPFLAAAEIAARDRSRDPAAVVRTLAPRLAARSRILSRRLRDGVEFRLEGLKAGASTLVTVLMTPDGDFASLRYAAAGAGLSLAVLAIWGARALGLSAATSMAAALIWAAVPLTIYLMILLSRRGGLRAVLADFPGERPWGMRGQDDKSTGLLRPWAAMGEGEGERGGGSLLPPDGIDVRVDMSSYRESPSDAMTPRQITESLGGLLRDSRFLSGSAAGALGRDPVGIVIPPQVVRARFLDGNKGANIFSVELSALAGGQWKEIRFAVSLDARAFLPSERDRLGNRSYSWREYENLRWLRAKTDSPQVVQPYARGLGEVHVDGNPMVVPAYSMELISGKGLVPLDLSVSGPLNGELAAQAREIAELLTSLYVAGDGRCPDDVRIAQRDFMRAKGSGRVVLTAVRALKEKSPAVFLHDLLYNSQIILTTSDDKARRLLIVAVLSGVLEGLRRHYGERADQEYDRYLADYLDDYRKSDDRALVVEEAGTAGQLRIVARGEAALPTAVPGEGKESWDLPVFQGMLEDLETGAKQTVVVRPLQESDLKGLAGLGPDLAGESFAFRHYRDHHRLAVESSRGIEGIVRFHRVGDMDGRVRQALQVEVLVVRPENQRGGASRRFKGVGELLMAAVVQASLEFPSLDEDQRGNVILSANTMSTSRSHPRGFYEHIGMSEIGNSDVFYFAVGQARAFLESAVKKYALKRLSSLLTFGSTYRAGQKVLERKYRRYQAFTPAPLAYGQWLEGFLEKNRPKGYAGEWTWRHWVREVYAPRKENRAFLFRSAEALVSLHPRSPPEAIRRGVARVKEAVGSGMRWGALLGGALDCLLVAAGLYYAPEGWFGDHLLISAAGLLVVLASSMYSLASLYQIREHRKWNVEKRDKPEEVLSAASEDSQGGLPDAWPPKMSQEETEKKLEELVYRRAEEEKEKNAEAYAFYSQAKEAFRPRRSGEPKPTDLDMRIAYGNLNKAFDTLSPEATPWLLAAVYYLGSKIVQEPEGKRANRREAIRIMYDYAALNDMEENRFNDALEAFGILANLPGLVETVAALDQAAEIYFQRSNFDKARELLEMALSRARVKGPVVNVVQILLDRARLEAAAQHTDQAIAYNEAAVRLVDGMLSASPAVPALPALSGFKMNSFLEGDAFRALKGRMPSDRLLFKKTMAMRLSKAGALKNLGKIALERKDWAQAKTLFREALSLYEEYQRMLAEEIGRIRAGEAKLAKTESPEREAAYVQVMHDRANHPLADAHLVLAWTVYLEGGQFGEAKREVQASLRYAHSQEADILDALVEARLLQEEERTKEAFAKALKATYLFLDRLRIERSLEWTLEDLHEAIERQKGKIEYFRGGLQLGQILTVVGQLASEVGYVEMLPRFLDLAHSLTQDPELGFLSSLAKAAIPFQIQAEHPELFAGDSALNASLVQRLAVTGRRERERLLEEIKTPEALAMRLLRPRFSEDSRVAADALVHALGRSVRDYPLEALEEMADRLGPDIEPRRVRIILQGFKPGMPKEEVLAWISRQMSPASPLTFESTRLAGQRALEGKYRFYRVFTRTPLSYGQWLMGFLEKERPKDYAGSWTEEHWIREVYAPWRENWAFLFLPAAVLVRLHPRSPPSVIRQGVERVKKSIKRGARQGLVRGAVVDGLMAAAAVFDASIGLFAQDHTLLFIAILIALPAISIYSLASRYQIWEHRRWNAEKREKPEETLALPGAISGKALNAARALVLLTVLTPVAARAMEIPADRFEKMRADLISRLQGPAVAVGLAGQGEFSSNLNLLQSEIATLSPEEFEQARSQALRELGLEAASLPSEEVLLRGLHQSLIETDGTDAVEAHRDAIRLALAQGQVPTLASFVDDRNADVIASLVPLYREAQGRIALTYADPAIGRQLTGLAQGFPPGRAVVEDEAAVGALQGGIPGEPPTLLVREMHRLLPADWLTLNLSIVLAVSSGVRLDTTDVPDKSPFKWAVITLLDGLRALSLDLNSLLQIQQLVAQMA